MPLCIFMNTEYSYVETQNSYMNSGDSMRDIEDIRMVIIWKNERNYFMFWLYYLVLKVMFILKVQPLKFEGSDFL